MPGAIFTYEKSTTVRLSFDNCFGTSLLANCTIIREKQNLGLRNSHRGASDLHVSLANNQFLSNIFEQKLGVLLTVLIS